MVAGVDRRPLLRRFAGFAILQLVKYMFKEMCK